jgi:hypothetical protein
MRMLACLVAMAGCSGMFRDGSATGHVESKGETGAWTLDTGKCYSGQREQYFGAIAYGPENSGIAIKLVKDSIKGWTAIVNMSDTCKATAEKTDKGCRAIILGSDNCKTLDIDIRTTNTTVNDIKVVEGTATLDCAKDADDEHYAVKSKITLDYCH